MIAAENRVLEIEGRLFSDFHETVERRAELLECSVRALAAMSAEEGRSKAGSSRDSERPTGAGRNRPGIR